MTPTRTEPTGSSVKTAPLSAAAIAGEILGDIDWISTTEGYCECPGIRAHTSKQGRRDCIIYLREVPTIHCLHSSCGSHVAETNRRLRSALFNGDEVKNGRKLSEEDKKRIKEREENNRIRQRAAKSLSQILTNYPWTYNSIVQQSPISVVGNESEHWRLLLQKFDPQDIVWIGAIHDSGKPGHAQHFRRAQEWLQHPEAPGPF